MSEGEAQIAKCSCCQRDTFWLEEKMLIPDSGGGAMPNEDMPEDVKLDFLEARSILHKSPRGTAALLRLALQKLMVHLGEQGDNINDDVKSLVLKGLPVQIQQSLDILRVVGNEAVHPGTLDLKDDQDTASKLFIVLNFIVESRISEPKRINELYSLLPQTKLDAIESRDKT